MKNPCLLGLKCPYRTFSEDAEILCTHPKLAKDAEDGELFGFADETICDMVEIGSDLDLLIDAYDAFNNGEDIMTRERQYIEDYLILIDIRRKRDMYKEAEVEREITSFLSLQPEKEVDSKVALTSPVFESLKRFTMKDVEDGLDRMIKDGRITICVDSLHTPHYKLTATN